VIKNDGTNTAREKRLNNPVKKIKKSVKKKRS
jgi:hypothetical protein